MSRESQLDQEIDDIDQRLEDGRISREEADEEQREVRRDYRGAAEEAAQEAHDRELENW